MKHGLLGALLRFIAVGIATVVVSVPTSILLWVSLNNFKFPFLAAYFFPFLVAVNASAYDASGRPAASFDPQAAVAATVAEWAVACIAYVAWSQRASVGRRTWTSAFVAMLIMLAFNYYWMVAFGLSLPEAHFHI
jgi:hypothetical protein